MWRATLLISNLFLLVNFYLQYFLSPKGRFLSFLRTIFTYACFYHNKRSYSYMTCVFICLYETTFITKSKKWTSSLSKSISEQVYYKVHKVDELKLFKSTSGQVYYKLGPQIGWVHYQSPQVGKFITKSTKWTNWNYLSGRVQYKVHKLDEFIPWGCLEIV